MSKNFYNTISATGQTLIEFSDKAKGQEDLILEFFQRHPNKEFTPAEITLFTFLNECPITSARRGITNLTIQGKLIKTGNQKAGAYGKPNYCWALNKF